MGFSLVFHFMLGMGASVSGITPPTPTARTTFILRHRRAGDVALPAPPSGSLYRLRRADADAN